MAMFANRKSVTTSAVGMGLIASNLDQLLTILVDRRAGQKFYRRLDVLEVTEIWLLGFSLFTQIVMMLLQLSLASMGRMTNAKTDRQRRVHHYINTTIMVLSFFITILNVAISCFSGHRYAVPPLKSAAAVEASNSTISIDVKAYTPGIEFQ